jgi:uncharacterized protein (TIGR02453 family)
MTHFSPELYKFLRQLKKNNNRDWFKANKGRYESVIKQPALEFIEEFGPNLRKLNPHFVAEPRAVGGSLFRIHRDTRFSKDKTPYKTAVGIHFRHEVAKDAHAPGFYLHIDPKECFIGAGIWHPDTATARRIRDAIIERPKDWKKAVQGKAFTNHWRLTGDSLKRPPRGVDADHPFVEDIKRKDFIAVADLSTDDLLQARLPKQLEASWKRTLPLMKFLCEALDVAF